MPREAAANTGHFHTNARSTGTFLEGISSAPASAELPKGMKADELPPAENCLCMFNRAWNKFLQQYLVSDDLVFGHRSLRWQNICRCAQHGRATARRADHRLQDTGIGRQV